MLQINMNLECGVFQYLFVKNFYVGFFGEKKGNLHEEYLKKSTQYLEY